MCVEPQALLLTIEFMLRNDFLFLLHFVDKEKCVFYSSIYGKKSGRWLMFQASLQSSEKFYLGME